MHHDLPAPGDCFEHYKLEARIGQGGFGSVYRARDLRMGRPVALKIISLREQARDRWQRVQREVDLSRKLVHPHTVRIYDFGVGSESRPFIAFELLEGETLLARLRQNGTFSVEETRRIAVCVLKSLLEAHELGIVHRDIKPTNVFLCRYAGESDFVKVLDFGIAKSADQDLTLHGWLIGTPAYMAPEQIVDKKPSPAADLYALGLVMAQMLTGKAVARGTGPEILAAQMDSVPLPLPDSVSESALGNVIRKATLKDLAQRYTSAEEMLADLSEPVRESAMPRSRSTASVAPVAYTNGGSTPPPPAVQSKKPWIAIGLLSGVLLGLIAVAAFLWSYTPKMSELAQCVATEDPSLSPPLLKLVAEKRGFLITEKHQVSATTYDMRFVHPDMVGVIRVESLGTLRDARWFEDQLEGPGTRASLRRGKHVISVWAIPRGKASFDRQAAESTLSLLAPPR
jgi:serine/threonine protein kinase